MGAYSNKQLLATYIKSNFNKMEMARTLGMSHQNIYVLMKSRPELKRMMEEAEDMRIDVAENQLYDLIEKQKNLKAIKFFLETKGRKRGYGQRIEVSNEGGEKKYSSAKIVNGETVIELK